MEDSYFHVHRKLDQSVDRLFQEAVISNNVVKKYKRSLSRSKVPLAAAVSENNNTKNGAVKSQTVDSNMSESEQLLCGSSIDPLAYNNVVDSVGNVMVKSPGENMNPVDQHKSVICSEQSMISSPSLVPSPSLLSALPSSPLSSTVHTTTAPQCKEMMKKSDKLLRNVAISQQMQLKNNPTADVDEQTSLPRLCDTDIKLSESEDTINNTDIHTNSTVSLQDDSHINMEMNLGVRQADSTNDTSSSKSIEIISAINSTVLHAEDQDKSHTPKHPDSSSPNEVSCSSKNSPKAGESDRESVDSVKSGVTSLRRGSEIQAGGIGAVPLNKDRKPCRKKRKKIFSFSDRNTTKTVLKRITNQQNFKKRQNGLKKGQHSVKKTDKPIRQTCTRSDKALKHDISPSKSSKEAEKSVPNRQRTRKRKRKSGNTTTMPNKETVPCSSDISVLERHKKALLDMGSNSVVALTTLEEKAQPYLQMPSCPVSVDTPVKKWSDGAHTFHFLENIMNRSHVGGVWKSIVQED